MGITTQRRPAIWPGLLVALVVSAIAICAPFFSFSSLDSGATSTVPATSLPPIEHLSATSYELRTITLANGKKIAARWNPCQDAITYKVNLSGVATAQRAALLGRVRTAFRKLAAVDGLTYRYTGSTTFVPKQGNLAQQPAEIVVAAVSPKATDFALTANSLGFGGVLWSTWSGGSAGAGAAVVRGYVVLDPAGLHKLAPRFGPGRTQGNLILHELGHATGLDHVHSGGQLMNPALTAAAPDGFAAGDRAGLKKIGAGAGCLRIPAIVKIADLD